MRIDQIIHGYKVVSNAKLLPEDDFTRCNTKEKEYVNTPGSIERDASSCLSYLGNEKAQRETQELPAYEYLGNLRRATAIFVKDGMETAYIN